MLPGIYSSSYSLFRLDPESLPVNIDSTPAVVDSVLYAVVFDEFGRKSATTTQFDVLLIRMTIERQFQVLERDVLD